MKKYLKTYDKRDIYCYIWNEVPNPIGVVQIMHGMQEHAGRYEDFAKFLNKHGYIVFADDHRAHGRTSESIEKLGKYYGGSLFYETLRDELYFSELIREQHPGLPIYVFGHSYGSFLAQNYIQRSSYYEKVILCGSACMKNRLDVALGRFIAKHNMNKKGGDKVAMTVERMMLKKYNKMVKTGSWINSDPAEVAKYDADPYCGTPFSTKFYYDFFTGLKYSYNKHKLQEINHNKPILLISGKNDPVGSMGKSVIKLFKLYNEYDLNVSMKLYEGGRHEILNEPKLKQTVYKDILEFLSRPNTEPLTPSELVSKKPATKAKAKKTKKTKKAKKTKSK